MTTSEQTLTSKAINNSQLLADPMWLIPRDNLKTQTKKPAG